MKSAHCIMLSLHNMNSDYYYLFYFYYYVMQITIIIIYFITCSLDKKITILKLAARYKDVCTHTCGAVVAIKRTPRRFFLPARLLISAFVLLFFRLVKSDGTHAALAFISPINAPVSV